MADARTLTERSEEELSWVGLAVADTIRAVELAIVALLALLVAPPLLILAVVVIVPVAVFAAVIGAIALPVVAIRHLHRHHRAHAHERVHRLAQWGRTDAARAGSWLRRAQAKLYVKG